MRQREMKQMTAMLAKLTPGQRKAMMAELAAFDAKPAAAAVVERQVGDHPACPHCQCERVVKNGMANGLQRFKCRGCTKTFNALTGTPLAHLHLRGKWVAHAETLLQGLTLHQVAERLNISVRTAFLWRHRFLDAPKAIQAQLLAGVAEADETFFRRSFKGQRKGMPRQSRKRGTKAAKRGLSDEQVPVLVARDRAGNTADHVLAADDAEHICAALSPVMAKDVILCTDGSAAMAAAARKLGVVHHAVNLSAGIRVDGPWHVQNANSYHSRLKDWMRHFRGVATKYLDSYLGWFRTIERSATIRLNPASLLAMATGHDAHPY